MLLLVYKNIKKPGRNTPKKQTSPIPIMKLANSTMSALIHQDDPIAMDSDDDVSLSKFGLHNLSESSNETISPLSTSLMNGRTFSPRTDSIWTKPKLNSTFCVNSMMCKSPNSTAETVFAKPSFKKYQKLVKDDSDSDLDESISSLSLGGPTKSKNKTNSIFSLRKFTASPNFVTPMATSRGRPLISPSKLGHSTSWVAGGYWGTESDRQTFNVDGSRSSSQSSGFESQTSSMNARNVFSQPPSREESVCGEPAPLLDRFSVSSYHSYMPQNFSRMSSPPVFPQMQYNGHVHIPQARFPQHPGQNLFIHQTQYAQNGLFKTPGASGLIKLPQVNTFASH